MFDIYEAKEDIVLTIHVGRGGEQHCRIAESTGMELGMGNGHGNHRSSAALQLLSFQSHP